MVNQGVGKRTATRPDMVQLEVPCEVLRRLLRDHRLVACELRCLNGRSRELVREAVRDCLRMPHSTTADFAESDRSLL
ncbi:MAG: hypothetical protein R6W80_10125 [Haliea sp.]